ncbi:MAG: T9SS type A sorting domain-containing protein [Candidatus Sabulitectum sp.]|nr:T9SS type A sorting domain-containing protein [Candidatus Sabulitectum sp.]
MKNAVTIAVILVFAVPVFGLNGSLETIGEIRVLNLWGTWEEMGYAHGYLLGPDLKEFYEEYFLELAGSQANVNYLRNYFPIYFSVPEEFSDYADGIIAGVSDTISIWSSVYGRNIDVLDIFISSSVPDLSAVVDFQQLLCSSASAWGSATSNDPALQGSPAVSRNLDYYVDTQETILDQHLLLVYDPEVGQDWISVAFPGFMGCLSGMNETGLNASLNMGNYQGTSQTTPEFVPICMALALGLSSEDFDNSGTCDISDVMASVTTWNRSNSYDIHISSPADIGTGGNPAVIAEINNHSGYAFRYATDESSISPDRMILTNHHRVLYPPVSCYRYSRLLDSLETNPDVTLNRLWNFMGAVGGPPTPGVGGTLQTMIFQPEQRRTGLAFASSGTASYSKSPEWIEWSDLYPNHDPQSVEEGSAHPATLHIYPNPVSSVLYITAGVSNAERLRLFDLSGRQMSVPFSRTAGNQFAVDISNLAPGLYLLMNNSGEITERASFLILR